MGEFGGLGRLLVGVGVVLVVAGVLVLVAGQVPGLQRLGRLPGDLVFRRGPVTVHVPLVPSILLSIVLTLALNLLVRR